MTRLDLEEHELDLLVQAVRVTDLLDELSAVTRRDGPMVESPQGLKAHPAIVEARQQSIALGRLLSMLRLPAGLDPRAAQGEPDGRPQRRAGARGVYGIDRSTQKRGRG